MAEEAVTKILGVLATGIGLIYLLNSLSDPATPLQVYVGSVIVIIVGLILLLKK